MSDLVKIALITSVPGVLMGLAAVIGIFYAKKDIKAGVNNFSIKLDGRLSELLELTRKSSHAAGVKDEKDNPTK